MAEEHQGSILARTARGAFWMVAWRMMTRLLGLGSTLILVRLLAPEDFGLIALAASFAAALELSLVIGVEDQIVRARAPSRAMYDTGFTLNLLRGLLVAVIIALVAAPAGRFFADTRLEPVLLALAVSAVLSGLANIGVVDFRRDLRFEKEFVLNLYPRVAGVLVTVAMAFLVRSHWALVAGILVTRLGMVSMGYAMHPFRPRLTLSAWRDLVRVSAWSWALSVTIMIKDRSESLVIGRLLGPTSVGHYAVGAEVATLPSTEFVDPICRACMPGFAASRRVDEEGASENYLRIMALLALLTIPAGVGMSAVAGPVVALGFGQNWLEAVPVVVVVALASTAMLFGNVSGAMLHAHTQLATLVGITLAAGIMRIGLLLVLIPTHGLPGAAVAVGASLVAEHMALVAGALVLLRMNPARLLARLWRPALASAVMALLLWQCGLGWAPAPAGAGPAVWLLLAGIGLGAASYVLVVCALWAVSRTTNAAEADMFDLLRRLLGRLTVLRPARGPV